MTKNLRYSVYKKERSILTCSFVAFSPWLFGSVDVGSHDESVHYGGQYVVEDMAYFMVSRKRRCQS